MKQGPSRRQWFLGLVGAVFGAGAARAVDRLVPGGKPPQSEATQLWLTCIYHEDDRVYRCSTEPLTGTVSVGRDPQSGNVLVEVRDLQGRLIRHGCHPSVEVQVHRGPSPFPGTGSASYSTYLGGSGSLHAEGPSTSWHGGTTTYTYDANGDLLSDMS
jgi:hypothetical protein